MKIKLNCVFKRISWQNKLKIIIKLILLRFTLIERQSYFFSNRLPIFYFSEQNVHFKLCNDNYESLRQQRKINHH